MQEKIQTYISEYFAGSLTDSEKQELKVHLESNPFDQKIFDDYLLLWEKSEQNIIQNPIDIESALVKIKRRIIFKRTNLIGIFLKAAAVLVLAVLFSSTYIYFFQPSPTLTQKEQTVIEQEISSMYGTRSKFQLSDGTKVYLNSGSKLIFPVAFNGDSRKVKLIGEAFFEVTPNAAKPFIVSACKIDVKVLGTAFNLKAYPNLNEISTTLVHGKVVLEKELDGKIVYLAELKPSDRAVYKRNENSVKITSEEDLDKYIGWKDGKLVFFNDPIRDVAEKLGNWYNVKIIFGGNNLNKYRFTATFSDEPIEQVLDLLCKSSPIKYKIKNASRLSDNSFSKKEIIFN